MAPTCPFWRWHKTASAHPDTSRPGTGFEGFLNAEYRYRQCQQHLLHISICKVANGSKFVIIWVCSLTSGPGLFQGHHPLLQLSNHFPQTANICLQPEKKLLPYCKNRSNKNKMGHGKIRTLTAFIQMQY